MRLGNNTPLAVFTLAVMVGAAAAAALLYSISRHRAEEEQAIDDRIAESFPASDPPWQP